jgi:hypothetical protein
MQTDSFTTALERLDPASRALLDLSLRRGMRTEEIADVLGADPESVEASRDEALRRIASDVGMHDDDVRDRLAEMPPEEWIGGNGNGHGNGNGAVLDADADAETEPQAVPAEPPATAEEPRKRTRILPLLLGLLLLIAVIVAIALGTSGNSDDSNSNQPSQSASPAQKNESGATKLTAIGKGSGTATVSDGKLTLNATLPRGSYEVWLYNSILDARSVGKGRGPALKVNADLPGNWKRYRFVDVSREPADGNPSHSGESVLRVPTKSLR